MILVDENAHRSDRLGTSFHIITLFVTNPPSQETQGEGFLPTSGEWTVLACTLLKEIRWQDELAGNDKAAESALLCR
jgi:hypothetical protein